MRILKFSIDWIDHWWFDDHSRQLWKDSRNPAILASETTNEVTQMIQAVVDAEYLVSAFSE